MKNTKTLCAISGLIMLAFASTANATVVDFGSLAYSEGQSVENTSIGIASLTSEAGNLHYTNSYGKGIFNAGGGDGDIYINFSQAVNGLSFKAGDGAGDYDAYAVSLYEFGTNNFLGTWSTPKFGGPAEPEWYTLAVNASNVGKVVFDPANSGNLPGHIGANGGVILNQFSYTTAPVPEPTSMMLFATGLAGLAFSRRKSK